MRRISWHQLVLPLAALAIVAPLANSASAQGREPPWRVHIMPWQTHAGQPRPWREDPRLKGRNAPGYPDDFQVFFVNPDSGRGERNEIMWVTAIAYDRQSDLFLGTLLNQPAYLQSVHNGDNVVFRFDAQRGLLSAVGGPKYAAAGWPRDTSAFTATLRDGIRAYRLGRNGHHMPEIERCIAVLSPALRVVSNGSSKAERFVGHYVLGRCLAEKYETRRAIEQFRAAIALDPDDGDAHMALLAELSVMAHQRPGSSSAAEEARWEREFVEELAIVRRRFATHDGVPDVLAMIFDPSHEAAVDSLWKPHIAKLRRIGFAVFRWKQR